MNPRWRRYHRRMMERKRRYNKKLEKSFTPYRSNLPSKDSGKLPEERSKYDIN